MGVNLAASDELNIRDFLVAAYADYAANGSVRDQYASAVAQYTHREMARQYAAVLNSTVENSARKR